MRATELHHMLGLILSHQDRKDDDLDVVVEIKEPWVGATPAIGIKQISVGFDWDKGRLILIPALELSLKNKDILKTHTLDGKPREEK